MSQPRSCSTHVCECRNIAKEGKRERREERKEGREKERKRERKGERKKEREKGRREKEGKESAEIERAFDPGLCIQVRR